MSSSADSHFAIEITVIFFLSIFFLWTYFFLLKFQDSEKKIMQTAKKIQQNLSFVFYIFYRFIFCAFFSLTFFFVVVQNFCVGITISIYFCINLILKVKLWCWMLLLLMSLHWLSFKTVSRNFFTQLAGLGRSYSWLMGCELYWILVGMRWKLINRFNWASCEDGHRSHTHPYAYKTKSATDVLQLNHVKKRIKLNKNTKCKH